MKASIVVVTATLAVAIVLMASLLIATGTHGKNPLRLSGETHASPTIPKPQQLNQTSAKPG